PAAIANQITEKNADRIQADIIVEAANGPTTEKATEMLTEKGKLLVPDVLASAGGATVSYFAWVQNKTGYYWEEDEIQDRLDMKSDGIAHVKREASCTGRPCISGRRHGSLSRMGAEQDRLVLGRG